MNTSKSSPPIRSEILDEAAGWLVEFRVGEAESAQRREFDAWLRASPEHVRAYLALLPTWENGARLDPKKQPDKSTLISWARTGSDNIIPLEATQEARTASAQATSLERSTPAPSHGKARILLALAASVAIAILGTWLYVQRDTYSTDVGEQRSVTLADGSIVQLNALSRVRIRFGEQERGVDLLEGQAMFRVAHEKTRPFVVHSGETKIRAVGTQFDVYRKHSGTIVTVLEGRVAVLPPNPAHTQSLSSQEEREGPAQREGEALQNSGAIFLSADQQVNVTPTAVRRPTRANIAAATAWTQRRLIFSATPLTEVAEEFNRYNARHLIIDDPGLETFRINGVFSSTNPAALLNFLREQPGISVTEAGQKIRVTRN